MTYQKPERREEISTKEEKKTKIIMSRGGKNFRKKELARHEKIKSQNRERRLPEP